MDNKFSLKYNQIYTRKELEENMLLLFESKLETKSFSPVMVMKESLTSEEYFVFKKEKGEDQYRFVKDNIFHLQDYLIKIQ